MALHPFDAHGITHESTRQLSETLAWYLRLEHFPTPEFEFTFHPIRRWRFDLAWPEYKCAIEIDGGVYTYGKRRWEQGRHTQPAGFKKDLEKLNHAAVLGWKVLRFTPDQIKSRQTWDLIRQALGVRFSGIVERAR